MDIIIRNETTGESFGFNDLSSGYNAAAEKIKELEKQGYQVGGDTTRVWDFVQPFWRETGLV